VQWIAWLSATVVAALTLSAFAFQTFQTKDQAREDKKDLKELILEIRNDVKEIKNRL